MDTLVLILSWGLILAGSFFYLVGAVGMVRMPDVFTRMHSTSVSETLGIGFLILGMMVQAGWTLNSAKLALILAILLYSGPIATHALARAALVAGVKPQLDEDRTGGAMAAPPAPKQKSGGTRKPPARAKSAPRKKKG